MKLIRFGFCYLLDAIVLIAICQLPALAQSPQPGGTDYTATSITFPLANPPQQVDEGRISVQLLDNPGVGVYCYWIVSNFTIGNSSPAGPVCVTNGPNTLVNGIRVSWSGVNGAASYDVLRTSNQIQPSGACACAVATGVTSLTATDTGLGAYTVNTFVPNIANFILTNEPQSAGVSNLAFRVNGSKVLSLPSNAVATFASAFTPVLHQFLTGMSAGGIFSAAQPASADISDGTGSGVVVRQTSANLITPVISSIVNTGTLTLPTSTDTLVGKNTTDTFNNKTIDTASPNTIKINGNTLSATAGVATVTIPNSTDTLVGRATTDTLTNKTLTSPAFTGTETGMSITSAAMTNPTINTGVTSGSGFKHQRFGATCTTAAAAGANCSTTLTWTVAFADTNYTAVCIGSQISGVPILTLSTKAAASVGITVWAATASAAQFTSVDCLAIHD